MNSKSNYKVVAELRTDLTDSESQYVNNSINELKEKLKIINIDNITYCKEPPVNGYDDFGAVSFFFFRFKGYEVLFFKAGIL